MSSKYLLNCFVVFWLLALGNLFRNNFLLVLFSINIKRKQLGSKYLCYTLYKDKTIGELEATKLCGRKVSHCHEIKLNLFLHKFIIIFTSSASKLMTQYLFIKGVHYHIIPGSHQRSLILYLPISTFYRSLRLLQFLHDQVYIMTPPVILSLSHHFSQLCDEKLIVSSEFFNKYLTVFEGEIRGTICKLFYLTRM